jgi:hypothetical protein
LAYPQAATPVLAVVAGAELPPVAVVAGAELPPVPVTLAEGAESSAEHAKTMTGPTPNAMTNAIEFRFFCFTMLSCLSWVETTRHLGAYLR